KTDSPYFNRRQVIKILQQLYIIDYRSKKAGLKAAAVDDKYHYTFYLNLLIIISRPLRPITQSNGRFFNNITITFKNWRALYSSKYIYSLPFNLEHHTF
ncbi:uncharacterized protein K441DRAFT_595604, partial [Cenococcum geophilum 1.58]